MSVPTMRVLQVHCRYREVGGEDAVVAEERALLEQAGIAVDGFHDDNARLETMSPLGRARSMIWSSDAKRRLAAQLAAKRPDVVHVHNTFPLLSPAIHHAVRAAGLPLVQTLHNYRLFCPSAILFRDGHVCEDCLGRKLAWPGVVHGCWRGSRAATGLVAAMLATHRAIGTFARSVTLFVALTDFARDKAIAGGLPAERIVVKPNGLSRDPGPGGGEGGYALFVGRLSAEKGIEVLLEAWRAIGRSLPLRIVGDGPLAAEVAQAVHEIEGVTWLGRRDSAATQAAIAEAALLVFPSTWYEGFPRVILEAYAHGTPVLAADIGAAGELVLPERTGLLVPPGNAGALAAAVHRLRTTPDLLPALRAGARARFEACYAPARNTDQLLAIYARACTIGRQA